MTTRAKRSAKAPQIEALVREDRELLKGLVKESLQEVLEAEMTEALGASSTRTQRGLSLRHAGRGRPRHLGGPSSSLSHEGQGRPPARDDRSRGRREGGRESEGCIRARTSGNGLAPGPGRAKAARVGVSFRRDP